MSLLRVNQLATTDDSVTVNVADLANNTVEPINSFAELRLTQPGKEGRIVFLTGYYETSNSGEGFFKGSLSSATDNSGTIASNGGLYHWERILPEDGSVTPQMFGALANGVQDDWPFIYKAYLYAGANGTVSNPVGGTIRFPKGVYMVGSTSANTEFLNKFGVKFVGTRGAVLKRIVGAGANIVIQGDYHHFVDLAFDWQWSTASTEVWPGYRTPIIYLAGSYNTIENCTLNNSPSSAIQVDGQQLFGVRTEPTPPYTPWTQGNSAFHNIITNNRIDNVYNGGIAQYWGNCTVITNNTILNFGTEGITCDTYTNRCRISGNLIKFGQIPGHNQGVGGIGIDSGWENIINGNVIEDIQFRPNAPKAGITLLAEEYSAGHNVITNNIIKNTGGPGINFITSQATGSNTIPTTSYAAPLYNHITNNHFDNCGSDSGYQAYLVATYGGTPPPFIAFWIQYRSSNPAIGNVIRDNSGVNHVCLDSPNYATNPYSSQYLNGIVYTATANGM